MAINFELACICNRFRINLEHSDTPPTVNVTDDLLLAQHVAGTDDSLCSALGMALTIPLVVGILWLNSFRRRCCSVFVDNVAGIENEAFQMSKDVLIVLNMVGVSSKHFTSASEHSSLLLLLL